MNPKQKNRKRWSKTKEIVCFGQLLGHGQADGIFNQKGCTIGELTVTTLPKYFPSPLTGSGRAQRVGQPPKQETWRYKRMLTKGMGMWQQVSFFGCAFWLWQRVVKWFWYLSWGRPLTSRPSEVFLSIFLVRNGRPTDYKRLLRCRYFHHWKILVTTSVGDGLLMTDEIHSHNREIHITTLVEQIYFTTSPDNCQIESFPADASFPKKSFKNENSMGSTVITQPKEIVWIKNNAHDSVSVRFVDSLARLWSPRRW